MKTKFPRRLTLRLTEEQYQFVKSDEDLCMAESMRDMIDWDRKEGMRNRVNNGSIENRLGHKARLKTPIQFRDLLVGIARACDPGRTDLILQPDLDLQLCLEIA